MQAIGNLEDLQKTVSNCEIIDAQALLGQSEGLDAEKSVAVSTADPLKDGERFEEKKKHHVL
ncbi:MAG: hypothetical protein HVN35_08395 [Methanobacteriaceae archaeon]|nr:hypothetical protein [Methanobacteriaceae archaeon]